MNGEQVTSFSSSSLLWFKTDTVQFSKASMQLVLDVYNNNVNSFDGYLAEFNFIDGTA